MKKIGIVLVLVFAVLSLSAQRKKELTTPVVLQYCLPKANFIVKVKVEGIKQTPGPYAFYAERKLGIKPEISQEKYRWELQDITVETEYIPDNNTVYNIVANSDYSAIDLSLSPEGFLAGLSANGRSADIAYNSGQYPSVKYTQGKELKGSIDINQIGTYTIIKEVLDTNYTQQEIDGVVKSIWDPIIRYERKSEQDNVDEAVKAIFHIRSERERLLLSDEDRPDGQSMKVLLKELDKLEKEYMELFMGKEERKVSCHVFECSPEKNGEAVPLFRFDESEGITDIKNVSVPLYSIVAENISIQGNANKEAAQGAMLYYRIPAVADVKLMRIKEELTSFRAIVPQLGILTSFPMDIISNERLSLSFYLEYGSLKSINR